MNTRSPQYYSASGLTIVVLLVIATLIFTPASYGQSTAATITGTVVDQTGAAIPDVKIALTNINTNVRRQITTNKEGCFILPQLEPGNYKLQAFREGFALVDIPDITLNANDRRDLQIKLRVGAAAESVTVSASAITVNTSDGTVASVIDRQFVDNLPLNGRTFQSLVMLTPGVVQTTAAGGSVGQFSVNGQRSNTNSFYVDGVSANAGFIATAGGGGSNSLGQQLSGATPGMSALGTTATMVSVDAMEEFKIQTSTYSAEFGRQPGGQVQLVTRSGTNTFHGSLFNYLRNDVLDARNYFHKDLKPPLRMNDFGGTLGGPIVKDRTFFFFSYEGLRLRLPETENSYVPSLRLREQAAPAFQTLLNAWPLPTGPEKVLNGKPTGWAPFLAAYSNPSSMDAFSLRIDHTFNEKLTLFGRYAETPSDNLERQMMVLTGDVASNRTLTLGATSALTCNLSNELRMNYTRSRGQYNRTMDDFGGAVPIDPSILLNGNTGTGTRLGTFTINIPGGSTSVLQAGDFNDSYNRQINIVDNLSYAMGGHHLKFGVDYRRLSPTYGPTEYYSMASVNSQDLMVNTGVAGWVPRLYSLNVTQKQAVRPRFDNLSLYLADTWRASRRLTVDYGVRWELNPPPSDANGIKPLILSGITGNLESGFDTSTATLAPPDAPFYKTFYTAFAPRVGVAYQLNQASGRETVLRGGFGVFYDLGSGQSLNGFSLYPFNVSLNTKNLPYPVSAAQAAAPALPTQPYPATIASNVFATNPDLKLPYTLQWNVALQQSLGNNQTFTLSYVASAGRDMLTTHRLNNLLNNNLGPRPNPNYWMIMYTTNASTSDYNSLQAQYQRRLANGLQMMASYTWSHALDTVSDEASNGSMTRGNADFDVRHNFSTAVTYEIPKLRTGALPEPLGLIVKSLANGWSVDSTVYAQTGAPFDLSAGTLYRLDGTTLEIRPDVVAGMPQWIDDASVPGGQRLNPDAFALPPFVLGGANGKTPFFTRQGTLGRNELRLPGIWQVNMSVGRKFNLTEKFKLQFKVDAFNVFNHPVFGDYDFGFAPGDTQLGVPKETLNKSRGVLNELFQMGGNRSLQLSLRITF
ncbi:MAG TPA: carboxypeptidase regulatory-like domain-containing protein [Clostridia bacterium]|nr:carboxypeptidase regulatory-like domain-containing protein [Clostridia bacterium]